MSYTEELIEQLRTCEKKIIRAPGEFKEERGHRTSSFI